MSYRIHRLRPIITAADYDTDAQAFFTAAGITDNTQKSAVNQLVLDLKSASIWTKMIAIYPFVGGTSTTHSYNLKNPAQYQITWSGTVTHDANGITGNGSTGYGNTGLTPSTSLTLNDTHISVYCRTVGGSSDNMVEVGGGASAALIEIALKNQGANGPTIGMMYRDDTSNAWVQKSDASAQGHWIFSRRAANAYEGYKNGTSFQTQTLTNSGTNPTRNLYILALNYNSGIFAYSNRNVALVSIGSGLNDTDASNFSTAVTTYQTTLGRNV